MRQPPRAIVAGLAPDIPAATTRLGPQRSWRPLGMDARRKARHYDLRARRQLTAGALLLSSVLSPLLVVPALAQGCGPTRLKVAEHVLLDVAPAKAWALVGRFQDMSWDKATLATSGQGGDEPDRATRSVKLAGGATFGESLYKYDAGGMNYSYHIDAIDVAALPVQNVSATIEVVPRDNGAKSEVRWRAAFYRYLRPDEGAPDAADARASAAVSAYLRNGLEGLKSKVDAKS